MNVFKSLSPLLPRAAAVLLVLLAAGRGAAQAPDPVEELRQALLASGDDRDPVVQKLRTKMLNDRIDAIKTLSDLRRTLELTEWKDSGPLTGFQAIDREARAKVGERLVEGAKNAAARKDAAVRMAVANMAGEIGANLRATDGSKVGFARSLTPILVQ